MPTVTLSEDYDEKLKKLVTEPFKDTRESIIQGLIDDEVHRRTNGSGTDLAKSSARGLRHLNPDSPESLSFTRITSAKVDGREVHRPKWNTLMDYLHVVGLRRLGSFDRLKRVTSARIREGKYERDGYKYLPDADLSIQGVGADVAWSHTLRLARELNVAITLVFEWRDDDRAAHRGESAILEWAPAES